MAWPDDMTNLDVAVIFAAINDTSEVLEIVGVHQDGDGEYDGLLVRVGKYVKREYLVKVEKYDAGEVDGDARNSPRAP